MAEHSLVEWKLEASKALIDQLKPEQYGGAWAIDHVYIDPHSR